MPTTSLFGLASFAPVQAETSSPAARLGRRRCNCAAVDLLELAGGNLAEADRGDELRIAVESGIDLLKDALWLDGHVVEVGSAKHCALAFADLCDPGIEMTELAGEHTFTRRHDQRL